MTAKQWKKVLHELDLYIAVICLAVLIAITFAGVFTRYIFNSPFTWQDEVQMMLFLWVACFGGSAAFRTGGHIAIDLLVDFFPQKIQRIIDVLIWFISAFVLGFLAWNSMGFVYQQMADNRLTDVLKFPRAIVYAPLPICSALMIIFFGMTTLQRIRKEVQENAD